MNFLDEMRKQGAAFKGKATRKGTTRPGGSLCKTPGLKIRSKGRGRGLARGRGRGPLGIPIGR